MNALVIILAASSVHSVPGFSEPSRSACDYSLSLVGRQFQKPKPVSLTSWAMSLRSLKIAKSAESVHPVLVVK